MKKQTASVGVVALAVLLGTANTNTLAFAPPSALSSRVTLGPAFTSRPSLYMSTTTEEGETTKTKRKGPLRRLRNMFGPHTKSAEEPAATFTTGSWSSADDVENPTMSMASIDTLSTAVEVSEDGHDKELSETDKLMKQVKEAGTAGVISYALWELGFWFVSVPVVLVGYYEVTGHFPNLSDKDDLAKLSAEAFAFVNFARFAVPLRIGLALSTTPWIQKNIVDRFMDGGNKPSE